MRARNGRPVIALVALALSACATAPATAPGGPTDRIAASVESSMRSTGFPAVTVAVARDGRIAYERAFGVSDVEKGTPALIETRYRIASLTKPMTATAVLQLVETGRIGLTASIREYVPVLPAAYDRVTIAELLRHTGGVRHYKEDAEYITTRHCDRLSDALAIFAGDPLDHPPGDKITYSTWGYTLLGLAIEQASGLSYPEYVRTRILEPAGMSATRVDTLELIPNRASGYTSGEDGTIRNADLLDTSCRIPAGGLVSTAGDVARFAMALQNGVLLRPETARDMMSPKLDEGIIARTVAGLEIPPGYVFPNFGYGWAIEMTDGERVVHHGGNQPGATAMLYMIPERDLTVVLLTNLDSKGGEISALAKEIVATVPQD